MLVPLELSLLAHQRGYLSPELALGWRIARHVREVFDGLEHVRIAARRNNDALMALSILSVKLGNPPADLSRSRTSKPWDFLFYHPLSGTVLRWVQNKQNTQLSNDIVALGDRLDCANDTVATIRYQRAVDALILQILNVSIDMLGLFYEHRCRKIKCDAPRGEDSLRCPQCGTVVFRRDLWEVDGWLGCLSCSLLEPAWFVCH